MLVSAFKLTRAATVSGSWDRGTLAKTEKKEKAAPSCQGDKNSRPWAAGASKVTSKPRSPQLWNSFVFWGGLTASSVKSASSIVV